MTYDDKDCDWFCDNCSVYMNNQPGFTTSSDEWTCTECGYVNDVSEDNIIDEDDNQGCSEGYSDGFTCINCQQSLRGGSRTLPWEDDDNAEAYIICPHCGCKNIENGDED
ncbi:hypothetical protein [Paenibacillus dakarensis]|uniref:hypothetical protein n=1 Tax=Paenibacillus dakarensis TaxID=1527293 RepID=UPI0012E0D392|nr:hypothetical protein [Paenibacillus dakarensis]